MTTVTTATAAETAKGKRLISAAQETVANALRMTTAASTTAETQWRWLQ